MISLGKKQIGEVHYGSHTIAYIYKGTKLVWTSLKSICCFDSGVWKRDKTWNNNMTWRRD